MSRERRVRIARAFAVLVVMAGVAVLAAPAMAAPPVNDDYADAWRFNQPGTTLPRDSGLLASTTAEATLQQFEIDQAGSCSGYDYGATVHFEAYPDRPGVLQVRVYSAAFFASVAVWRFTPSGINEGECRIADLTNRVADDYYPAAYAGGARVQEGHGYNIQVGGLDADGPGPGGFGSGPYQIRLIFYPDTDRDGWLDVSDLCPNLGGRDVDKYKGCPDDDQDNFPEGPGGNDLCPGQTGLHVELHRGCPDNDNDTFPEGPGGNDLCPGQTGLHVELHQGCPDNDDDHVPENGSDLCPAISALKPARGLTRRDQNGDGCPDILRLHNLITVKKSITGTGSGILLHYLKIRGVPNGSRVTCRVAGRRCPRTPFTASTPLVPALAAARNTQVLGFRRLRFGTKIEVSVKAKYANTFVYRFRVIREASGTGWFQEKCLSNIRGKLRPKECR